MTAVHRYRLDEQLTDPAGGSGTQNWRGVDLTLDRPVTVRLTDSGSEAGQRLRLQTQSLASLEHAGLLHILDSYTDGRKLAIVTERLPQRTLADELDPAQGGAPLPTAAALTATVAVAEALHALHDAGFSHGGVTASQVGRRAEGGFVVTTGPPTADAVLIPATRRGDVRSVAALAHELLTGEPPAERDDGSWKIDGGVPPQVQPLLLRAGADVDPWPDAASLVRAIHDVVAELPSDADARSTRRVRDGWRAERRWLIPVAVVAAIAGLLALGGRLLTRPVTATETATVTTAVTAAESTARGPVVTALPDDAGRSAGGPVADSGAPAATSLPERILVPVEIDRITDFDPQGDDVFEHPERLADLNNGNPASGWHTARYATSSFGDLKTGVGLLVELGGTAVPDLARVVVESLNTGWTFQLLASVERRATLIEWGEPVAEMLVPPAGSGTVTLEFDSLRAATLLLWITDLGDELPDGGHRVTVTEFKVSRYHQP
ncbi:MAG TPA: hypothetical protein DEP66_04880 [Acidimicrobiaceae bacterium]|nr:hypothetical protein [Acidimicrobiaceae bacterium]HCB37532.1 hypothetical protein [Acidimicrobiaceae bacterium]